MIGPKPIDGQLSLLPNVPAYRYDGKCRRCGRVLRGKRSKKRGFGPTCSTKRDQPIQKSERTKA